MEDFKKIKYDNKFPTPFNYNFMDVNKIMDMKPDDYPEIADLIKQIQNWDRSTDASSTGAGAYAMFYYTHPTVLERITNLRDGHV